MICSTKRKKNSVLEENLEDIPDHDDDDEEPEGQ